LKAALSPGPQTNVKDGENGAETEGVCGDVVDDKGEDDDEVDDEGDEAIMRNITKMRQFGTRLVRHESAQLFPSMFFNFFEYL